jgi:hypothetical protein
VICREKIAEIISRQSAVQLALISRSLHGESSPFAGRIGHNFHRQLVSFHPRPASFYGVQLQTGERDTQKSRLPTILHFRGSL